MMPVLRPAVERAAPACQELLAGMDTPPQCLAAGWLRLCGTHTHTHLSTCRATGCLLQLLHPAVLLLAGPDVGAPPLPLH